ncbi:general secretion pathway protein GspB, partial [bacterium]|nr:general secretion pathway protein GspB [bacterium]
MVVDLAVSGIIWDEVNPQAIINSKILAEGDSIGGFSIEKIEKQKVILSDGKKRIELNI